MKCVLLLAGRQPNIRQSSCSFSFRFAYIFGHCIERWRCLYKRAHRRSYELHVWQCIEIGVTCNCARVLWAHVCIVQCPCCTLFVSTSWWQFKEPSNDIKADRVFFRLFVCLFVCLLWHHGDLKSWTGTNTVRSTSTQLTTLAVLRLPEKFLVFYGSQKFFTLFKRAR